MLFRRISGGYVCWTCRLSLASRSNIRDSPFRTPNSSFTVRHAPSRNYSKSLENPSWTGRPPIDGIKDSEKPRLGLEEQPQDSAAPAPNGSHAPKHPREQNVEVTPDPWQGVFEQAIDDRKSDTRHAPRHNQTQGDQDNPQRIDKPEKDSVYRQIRVSSKGPAKPRRGTPVTLNTGPEFYTAKGQRLKPTNQTLPIDILGKPGHALVLRDAGPRKKKKLEQMAPDEPSGPDSLMNLAKIYESTQGDVPSSAEVLRNIDELRPSESVLPRREFDALKKTLYKGFTKAQLAAYIHKASSMETEKDNTILELRPWVLEKWPWIPEADSALGTSDALLQGYVSKSTTPKEKLAVGLMRQCWGLGMQELQSQLGYLDIRVQDLQFELLMLGNRRWLESISKSLFEPGTQIEMIRSEKVVRIVAPKVTAELILQEINTLLDQARTRLLDAEQISPKRLDQSVLDEAGKITQTVIRYDTSGNNIQVSWIASPNDDPQGLEDLADVSHRLLYSAYGYKQAGGTTMEVQPEPYAVGGWYLSDYNSQSKMAWKDRVAKWARWAIATPRRGASPEDTVQILPNRNLCRSLDRTASPSFAPDGWSVESEAKTRAVFGHVLHREPVPSKIEDAFPANGVKEDRSIGEHQQTAYNRNNGIHDKLDWHLDRIMVPIIPPLNSLAALTAKSAATTTHTSVLLRFLPAPGNPALPTLELTLLTDPDTDTLTPHCLRAVTRVLTHDILLPSHPVDIRLAETTSYLLPGSSISSSCPELATFLSSSDLRPQEGILSTPPRPAPLHLPSRILSSYSTEASETTEASYIFAGLELHRHVSTPVSGWKLSYTSIEAGQGGGRRAELALEGIRADGDVDERGMPLNEFDMFEKQLERGEDDATGAPAGPKERIGADVYVETLARLALGRELAWSGDLPGKEGSEGAQGPGRGHGEM